MLSHTPLFAASVAAITLSAPPTSRSLHSASARIPCSATRASTCCGVSSEFQQSLTIFQSPRSRRKVMRYLPVIIDAAPPDFGVSTRIKFPRSHAISASARISPACSVRNE